jgi:hypothetical protein
MYGTPRSRILIPFFNQSSIKCKITQLFLVLGLTLNRELLLERIQTDEAVDSVQVIRLGALLLSEIKSIINIFKKFEQVDYFGEDFNVLERVDLALLQVVEIMYEYLQIEVDV